MITYEMGFSGKIREHNLRDSGNFGKEKRRRPCDGAMETCAREVHRFAASRRMCSLRCAREDRLRIELH